MLRVLVRSLFGVLIMCASAQAQTVPVNTTAHPASAQGLEAHVIAVSNRAGNPFLDVVVALPKGIDNAAREGNADFGLVVTVTYIAQSGDVVTLDSGRLSIELDTTFVSELDNQTVAVSLQLQLGTASPPAASPSYAGTAEVLLPHE